MKREFLQSLQVGDSALSKDVIDAIMAENGRDIQTHKQAAQQWQQRYEQAVADHAAALAQRDFDSLLKDCVNAAKGRNLKAITALLDVEALKASPDPREAVEQAVRGLKQEQEYLFDTAVTPPPYAAGTGSTGQQGAFPQTLAGALRERFELGQ